MFPSSSPVPLTLRPNTVRFTQDNIRTPRIDFGIPSQELRLCDHRIRRDRPTIIARYDGVPRVTLDI